MRQLREVHVEAPADVGGAEGRLGDEDVLASVTRGHPRDQRAVAIDPDPHWPRLPSGGIEGPPGQGQLAVRGGVEVLGQAPRPIRPDIVGGRFDLGERREPAAERFVQGADVAEASGKESPEAGDRGLAVVRHHIGTAEPHSPLEVRMEVMQFAEQGHRPYPAAGVRRQAAHRIDEAPDRHLPEPRDVRVSRSERPRVDVDRVIPVLRHRAERRDGEVRRVGGQFLLDRRADAEMRREEM